MDDLRTENNDVVMVLLSDMKDIISKVRKNHNSIELYRVKF